MFGAFGARRVHRVGDAIEPFNHRARRIECGLSFLRRRLLDNAEMTKNQSRTARRPKHYLRHRNWFEIRKYGIFIYYSMYTIQL